MRRSNVVWRLRFGLRSLLLLVTLVAIASSWLGWRIRQARLRNDAVTALGANAIFEPRGTWVTTVRDLLPEQIDGILGDTLFSRVVSLDAVHTECDDDIRKCLLFPDLEGLQLVGLSDGVKSVTGDGLSQLAGLGQLRELSIIGADLTETQLFGVSNLASVEQLDVSVEDAGIALTTLVHMPHLRDLRLFLDPPSDICFLRLPTSLETLELYIDALDGAAFSHVFSCYNVLTCLDLGIRNSCIDHETLATIARLNQLKILSLRRTGLTNEGLDQLRGLVRLERLHIGETNVTRDAFDKLISGLPNLKKVTGPDGFRRRIP